MKPRPSFIPRGDRGATILETAAAFPLLFTLMFCFMELCLLCYTRVMIAERARDGTRYAMFHGASCPTSASPTCEVTASEVNTYVSGLAWPNLAGGTMTVATTYPSGSEAVGSLVQVQVTYVFPITMPFVPRNALTLKVTSETTIVQ